MVTAAGELISLSAVPAGLGGGQARDQPHATDAAAAAGGVQKEDIFVISSQRTRMQSPE